MADELNIRTIAGIIGAHRLFLRSIGQPKYLCLCGSTFDDDSQHDHHVAEIIARTGTS